MSKTINMSQFLPNAFSFCTFANHDIWKKNGSLSDLAFVKLIIFELHTLQSISAHKKDTSWIIEFSRYIAIDLIEIKKNYCYKKHENTINYIQFIITVIPLSTLVKNKRVNEAYDWISLSFTDDMSKNQVKTYDIQRFLTCFICDENQSILSFELITRWIGDFYYVCRVLSANVNVASEIYNFSDSMLNDVSIHVSPDMYTWAITNIACWAENNNFSRAPDLVKKIELEITKGILEKKLQTELYVCLSTTVSNVSSKKHHEWAKLALRDKTLSYEGHQKLHLLINSIPDNDADYIDEITPEIINEIKLEQERCYIYTKERPVERLRMQDRLSDIYSPFIGICINNNKGESALNVLKAWYQVDQNYSVSIDNLLIVYPNHFDSLRYASGTNTLILERNLNDILIKVVRAANSFFGVSSSIARTPDFNLETHIKNRFGVPIENESDNLECNLVEFFQLNILRNFIYSLTDIKCFVPLPSNQYPFQYLCNKYIGKTWPLTSSLEQPRDDRKVENVCLWCGAGSMTEEMESKTIISIFEQNSIKVDYYSSDKANMDDFKKIFESDFYDIIWIMSHGEYDHWLPGSVSIEIGGGSHLSLEEFQKLIHPVSEKRRLLFLNICDGATHSSIGGIPKLGIASSLANQYQCVISHLWPVNPYIAATFGALYALSISSGTVFFESYIFALENICKGNETAIKLLKNSVDTNDSLTERLENINIDFRLMIHSGSASFFQ